MKIFRISEVLADKNVNFFKLQKETGIRYETIKKLCDNTAKDCKLSTLIKLSEYLQVKIVDLFISESNYEEKKIYNAGYNKAIEDISKLKID